MPDGSGVAGPVPNAIIDNPTEPKMPYRVKMSSVGCAAFGEDETQTLLDVFTDEVDVGTLAEASQACLNYIAEFALPEENWVGEARDTAPGGLTYRVAHDGDVFGPTGTKPVYSPPLNAFAPEGSVVAIDGFGDVFMSSGTKTGTVRSVPGHCRIDGMRVEFDERTVPMDDGRFTSIGDQAIRHRPDFLERITLPQDLRTSIRKAYAQWHAAQDPVSFMRNDIKEAWRDAYALDLKIKLAEEDLERLRGRAKQGHDEIDRMQAELDAATAPARGPSV